MDGTKLNEEVLSTEIADELKKITKSVLDELLPKEKAVEDKPAIDLNEYIKKEDVEKAIEERLEDRKKAGSIIKTLFEPKYHGAGNEEQKAYEAISRAKTYGIDVEKVGYQKSVKLDNSNIEIKTDREKADTAMAGLMYKAILDKDYSLARKIEQEFADPQSLANKEKTLVAGSGSGSYTVPVGYEAVLIARRDEAMPIMGALSRMETNELTGYVPYEISLPAVYWETEGVDMRVSQPVWNTHLYSVKEQRSTTILTRKLELVSNIDPMATIASEQGRALGADLYKRMVTGTGLLSLPLGLGYISVPSTQSIVVGEGISQFLSYTAAYNHLTSLASVLPAQYADDAVWMMNAETYRRIISARDTTGRSIFDDQTTNYLRTGNEPQLLGKRVYRNSNCNAPTNTKASAINQIFYFVPRYFMIVTLKGITVDIADQATVGGTNLWAARSKAISTSNYLTMFSTSPYAFARISDIGLTADPS